VATNQRPQYNAQTEYDKVNMNRIMQRPMFRKGGSAGEGITSGLAPRQNYQKAGDVEKNDLSKINLRNMDMQQIKDLADRMAFQAPPMQPDTSLRDFKIDFGLDLVSRSPSGNIFQTAGAAAKEPFSNFRNSRAAYNKAAQDRAINKYNSQTGMFETLLGAQADILGSDSSGSLFRDEAAARELRRIIPRLSELKEKRQDETITLSKEEQIELQTLQEEFNLYRKKDVGQEVLVDIYVKGKGENYLPDKMDELFKADLRLGENRKYTGAKYTDDPQVEKDAIEAIKKEIQALTYAQGGRAGYANGEIVEEQITETETMAPGPQAMSDNPISYDQLRARLPAEITDDIVELMTNSAEALEDFAMISSQQDVDLFNQKYSVNLVLPSEA
jgi:hypothetical protein